MPGFHEAKETLRQFYIDQGFKLVDEAADELRFSSGLDLLIELAELKLEGFDLSLTGFGEVELAGLLR